MPWFSVGSYCFAAFVYLAITAILLSSRPGTRRATLLVAAAAMSAVWAGGITLLVIGDEPGFAVLVGLDALHLLAWIACILSAVGDPSVGRSAQPKRWLLWIATAMGFTVVLGALVSGVSAASSVYAGLLGMALIGLIGVEQVFRNADEEQRNALRLLSVAIGGIFVIDLFVYSQAILLGRLVPILWDARGIENAALGPVVVFAIKRQVDWERQLFVSRQMTFYTASLLGVGGYLLVMGVVGYVITAFGGEWGVLLELAFLAVALALLVVGVFSGSIQKRVKVFLVKHFYKNKYDYREEWLRLTERLGKGGDLESVARHALQGIAGIIGTDRGDLWLLRDGRAYEWMLSIGADPPSAVAFAKEHPMVRFLETAGWVIDSQEYAREPQRYGNAFEKGEALPTNSLIVPLDCQGSLQGFLILARPPQAAQLNFEDHDILKTAGKQIAVVLAQALAQEQLAETRQFEAMNKLSTFLMHDLKNIVAQQELVVANAQRFRHRPEFIDDAITTVRAGAQRMRRVLEQLRETAKRPPSGSRVDVSKVLMEVRSRCSDRQPIPAIPSIEAPTWAGIEREQLTSVLTHLIRNAQDATPADGRVAIDLTRADGQVLISVADTGCGMDRAFIRDELFKPFHTTKGIKGMGIGAYQVRDIVRSVGGDVEVTSEPGRGTTFVLRIPQSTADVLYGEPAA